MDIRIASFYTVFVGLILLTPLSHGQDLKAYYEQQKSEIFPSFKAPQLGSEITLTLAAGQTRSGILMKLTDTEVSFITDSGSVIYKKTALHETSRSLLFADDYAHANAMERTREYKQQLHSEAVKTQQADVHNGYISVTAKTKKDSEKEDKEGGKENKGNTKTTIKTRTEIQYLSVTLSNNTTHPDTYTLEWYFYAESLDTDLSSLHDSGSKNISVGARQREQHEISSKAYTITEVTVEKNSSGNNSKGPSVKKSGEENDGYLILLKYGDEILDKKASSKSFLTDEWINKL